MAIELTYPVAQNSVITQTYDQHVKRAKKNGWCWMPGSCASGVYYYGGIDYGVMNGTPIKCAAQGAVIKVEHQGGAGYGLHVRVQHEAGYITIYAHLQEVYVKVGDVVAAGQVLGLSDNTGYSSGPHLHFEVRENGIPIDPQPLLSNEVASQPETSSGQPAAGTFAKGAPIKLKERWEYVNLRPVPRYGFNIPVLGRFLPGDTATVVRQEGEMLCILDLINFKVWVHGGYVEPC